MMNSLGSTNPYIDAELAYRRQGIQHDFAAINWAAQQRGERRALAAEARAAGRPAPVSAAARRFAWIARWHGTARPATH